MVLLFLSMVKKRIILHKAAFLFFLVSIFNACQSYKAPSWIGISETATGYSQTLFRNEINLEKLPDSLYVEVSANQRYKLYVNGNYAGMGPQISDQHNHHYNRHNLASFLIIGENVIAAEVMNFGDYSGSNMFPAVTGFWLNCPAYPEINSSGKWKTIQNTQIFPLAVKGSGKIRGGALVGPSDSLIINSALKNWKLPAFDDRNWKSSRILTSGIRKPVMHTIPLMERKREGFYKIVSGEGEASNILFNDSTLSFRVKPNSKLSLIIDNRTLTTGFPEIIFSGGRGAGIKISYAESLYKSQESIAGEESDPEGKVKGHRDSTRNKEFIGFYDYIQPDGGRRNFYSPSWFRTYRYIKLEIQTADSPLIIDEFYGVFTAYPFRQNAVFQCDNQILERIWETGWRTARLCSWETYMDCPYYEQLQYVGDTRIQALVSLYNSGDTRLMKNAIEQFSRSIDSTGLTKAAYPDNGGGIIPPFSLFWTLMISDYFQYSADLEFILPYLDKIRGVIDWHLQYLDSSNAVLKGIDYWNFVDWPDEWEWDPEINTGGMPEGVMEGKVSTILNLQFVYALQEISRMLDYAQYKQEAKDYRQIARSIRQNIYRLSYDSDSGYLLDTPGGSQISQHANLLAVITGLIPSKDAGNFIERVAKDKEIIQTTIYYRFYLFEALRVSGREDLYTELLDPWTRMLDLGLTTFAERHDPTRSDCHAWGASPNYHLLSLVCGIRPMKPGFSDVLIKPALTQFDSLYAEMPHPNGRIRFDYRSADSTCMIILPPGVGGKLIYQDKSMDLKSGSNLINI